MPRPATKGQSGRTVLSTSISLAAIIVIALGVFALTVGTAQAHHNVVTEAADCDAWISRGDYIGGNQDRKVVVDVVINGEVIQETFFFDNGPGHLGHQDEWELFHRDGTGSVDTSGTVKMYEKKQGQYTKLVDTDTLNLHFDWSPCAPTPTPEPTQTNTPQPSATNTAVPTATKTVTVTVTAVPSRTVTVVPTTTTPEHTQTPEPTSTNTPEPTSTNTPEPTSTNTPEPTSTNTPEPTSTNTPEPTSTNTPEPTSTNTPQPTSTNTPQPTSTNTPEHTRTNTPTSRTSTPVSTATRTSTATVPASTPTSQGVVGGATVQPPAPPRPPVGSLPNAGEGEGALGMGGEDARAMAGIFLLVTGAGLTVVSIGMGRRQHR